ncbi:MAG: phosphate signaling complex protein PhoU [Acidimicrobiia bacterium]
MRESVRHHFDASLVELKEGTIHMAGLVLENIHRTSEAILENRLDLVERVISADDEVDRRYAALEQQLFEVVARQQPVAGDLRFLISLARMLHEVERCGDLAVNTAKALDRAAGFQLPGGLRGMLSRLCRDAAGLFAEAIDALADLDGAAGEALDARDDVVDELVDQLMAALLGGQGDIPLDVALELALVARYMERIADHGVNVGDHVSYIVTGNFPQHRRLPLARG